MNNDMPISMFLEEMKKELMGVVEKYAAHPSIARLVVKEVYDRVCAMENACSATEKEEYMKKMQENQETKKEGGAGE